MGFLTIASILLIFSAASCVFPTEAEKKTARRLVDRSEKMLDDKARGEEIEIAFYRDQVVDALLNIVDIGEPKIATNINDPIAVEVAQTEHENEQKAESLLKSIWAKAIGFIAGFFGLGGLFVKVKSGYDTAKNGYDTMNSLFSSSVIGIQKYKDEINSKLQAIGIDKKTIKLIENEIGRDFLNNILKKEAEKTAYGVTHKELVNKIKSRETG